MTPKLRGVGSLAFGLVLTTAACSSGGSNPPLGSGGAPGSGGVSGTGGAAQTGGHPGSGGAASGGVVGSGGAASGGALGWGGAASGGALGSGGRNSGGTTSSGGAPSSGGVNGGVGSTGTGAAGQAGRTGTGSGGTAPGSGGSAAGGGGGRASGTGTGGAAGSNGTGNAMRSEGCGKTPTLTSGSHTIQSGQSRSYIVRIPSGYDNSHPYRLIFAFHWNGGTMQDIDGGGTSGAAWSYYGLQAQANNSTIFVAAQGLNNGWANSGGADLKLTDDLIKLIEGDLCVDTTQVFSVGFSYGGSMSYELACARPTVFRAVAVYSGGVLSGCDGGTQPVAYLGIHGVSDGTLNISGGRSMRDRFVMNNGCTPMSPPEPSAGSGKHTCTSYQGCKAGYPVEWCAFDGGHTPGNVDGGGDDGAKTWTKGEVWKFFTQFQ